MGIAAAASILFSHEGVDTGKEFAGARGDGRGGGIPADHGSRPAP